MGCGKGFLRSNVNDETVLTGSLMNFLGTPATLAR
jgi:hypothetical protein